MFWVKKLKIKTQTRKPFMFLIAYCRLSSLFSKTKRLISLKSVFCLSKIHQLIAIKSFVFLAVLCFSQKIEDLVKRTSLLLQKFHVSRKK